MSHISEHFDLTDDEWDNLDIELHENCGSRDEMIFNYYFVVPKSVPKYILKKTGWKSGEIVDVPLWVVDDCGKDEYEIAEEEFTWVRHTLQTSRIGRLAYDLDRLKNMTSETNIFERDIKLKMVYTHAVTLLEAYLCESAKHLITVNKNAFKNAVKYFSEQSGSERFSLDKLLSIDPEKYVIGLIAGLTFHNWKTAEKFLSAILSVQIDLSGLKTTINKRHDIIHRNGFTIDGEKVDLSNVEVLGVLNMISDVVFMINEIVVNLEGDEDLLVPGQEVSKK